MRQKYNFYPFTVPAFMGLAFSLSACFQTSSTLSQAPASNGSSPEGSAQTGQAQSATGDSTSSSSNSTSIPGGARAAKIIFRQSSSSGSFDSAPSTGTRNNPGNGHQAKRVFNADGSLLSSGGPTASSWPKWLSGFEIGISGASNTAAPNSDCARFAATSESVNDSSCQFDTDRDGAFDAGDVTQCGAPDGYFRVSEYDCTKSGSSTNAGNGGPTDGVYLRATFNRDSSILGTNENILVILEYAASVLNSAASEPSTCFSSGVFSPTREGCTDQLWQAFMKHTPFEVVQPYMMIAPPATHVVNRTQGHFGGLAQSKQFILPLSGDTDITVLQLSRIKGPKNLQTAFATESTDAFTMFCSNEGDPNATANSAGCVGMVFYSMTFIRM